MISTNETMTNIKSGIMQKQTSLQRADGEITTLIDFDFTKRMATINCNYRNKYSVAVSSVPRISIPLSKLPVVVKVTKSIIAERSFQCSNNLGSQIASRIHPALIKGAD